MVHQVLGRNSKHVSNLKNNYIQFFKKFLKTIHVVKQTVTILNSEIKAVFKDLYVKAL
jgi:hypothetical protein